MASCSMCSARVTAATSPCAWGVLCMGRAGRLLTAVRRPECCPRVMPRESWAVGPAGVSRCLPLHHLSLQSPSQGMHQPGAPQHSPACPAPGQHGCLLAGMEGWAEEQEGGAGLCWHSHARARQEGYPRPGSSGDRTQWPLGDCPSLKSEHPPLLPSPPVCAWPVQLRGCWCQQQLE